MSPPPLVAVLCAQQRAHPAVSGVALALAKVLGYRCALAGGVGAVAAASLGAAPAARRAAADLRGRGLPAAGRGRLVWLADARGAVAPVEAAVRAAATSAELARAAAATGLPGAVALPFARTAALDRVLAWHDAIVVVPAPEASSAVVELAVASLASLGRPVIAAASPTRVGAALAVGGVRAPAEALAAVAALALAGSDGRG